VARRVSGGTGRDDGERAPGVAARAAGRRRRECCSLEPWALKTIGPLQTAWNEFSTGLASTFDAVITAIRQAWTTAASAIAQSVFYVMSQLSKGLETIEQFDPSGLISRIRASLDQLNPTAILETLEADRQRTNADLSQARQQRDDRRAAELNSRQAALAKSIADTEAAIRAARDAAVENAQAAAAQQAKLSGLAQIAADASEEETKADKPKRDISGAIGATSAAAAALILAGASRPEERAAKASEEVAKNTRKSADKLESIDKKLSDENGLAYGM